MNKKLVFIIFVLLVGCFVPVVLAHSHNIAYQFIGISSYIQLYEEFPLSGSGIAQIFNHTESVIEEDPDEGWLDYITVWLYRIGNPNFNISIGLVDATDWDVSDSLDVSDFITTSTTVKNSSTVADVGGDQNYNFEFSNDVWLFDNHSYALVVYCHDVVVGDGSNYVRVGVSNDASIWGGYVVSDGDYVWSDVVGFDMGYVVVGYNNADSETPPATPTPSPVPAVTQNVVPSDPFVAVPSYYMVLLVLFACVAVLAGLYVTFEREGENKGVALLFVLVGLVIFVVLIVGYFVGF